MLHGFISVSYAVVGLIYIIMFCISRFAGAEISEKLERLRDIIHAACALLLAFAYMMMVLA